MLGSLGNAALAFVFARLVTHSLSPRSAGALFEAIAIFTICSTVATLGADVGLLRGLPRELRRSKGTELIFAASAPTLAVAVCLAASVFIFSPQLASVFVHHANSVTTAGQLRTLAVFIPCSVALTVVLAAVRAWAITPYVGIQNFLVPALRVGLLTSLLFAVGVSPATTALSWAAPIVLGLALSLCVLANYRRRNRVDTLDTALEEEGRTSRDTVLSFWRFTAPRSLENIFQVMIMYFDVVMVGALASSHDAAVYSIASRYLIAGTFALSAVAGVIGPALSLFLHDNDRVSAYRLYQVTTAWIVVVSWPVLLILAAYSPVLMQVFGSPYRRGAEALTILALAALVNAGTGNNAIVLLMAGKSRTNLSIAMVGFLLNVVINLVLIPREGYVGASVAWAVSIVCTNVLVGYMLWRTLRFLPFGLGWLAAAASSLLAFGIPGLVLRMSSRTSGSDLLVAIAGGSGLYLVLVYKLRIPLGVSFFRGLLLKEAKRSGPDHRRAQRGMSAQRLHSRGRRKS